MGMAPSSMCTLVIQFRLQKRKRVWGWQKRDTAIIPHKLVCVFNLLAFVLRTGGIHNFSKYIVCALSLYFCMTHWFLIRLKLWFLNIKKIDWKAFSFRVMLTKTKYFSLDGLGRLTILHNAMFRVTQTTSISIFTFRLPVGATLHKRPAASMCHYSLQEAREKQMCAL